MRRFGATSEKGTCLWCGRKLTMTYSTEYERLGRVERKATICCGAEFKEIFGSDDGGVPLGGVCSDCGEITTASYQRKKVVKRTPWYDKPGYEGNGSFCSLRCGYQFGARLAELGRRLVGAKDD